MTTDNPFPRDERHYCPTCNQHYALHTNFPASASEPPPGWRCEEVADKEHDDVDRRDETWAEYELNYDKDKERRR